MAGQWELDEDMAIITLHQRLDALSSNAAARVAASGIPGQSLLPRAITGLQSPVKYYPGEAAPPQAMSHSAAYTSLKRSGSRPGHSSTKCNTQPTQANAAEPLTAAPSSCSSAGAGHALAWHEATCCVLQPVIKPVLHQQVDRDRASALLLMEKKLTQLNAELAESRELKAKHRQQLAEINAAFKQKLKDAEGAVRSKLEATQLRLAQHTVQRRQQHLLSQCTAAWLQCTRRQQQLQQLVYQLQLRQLRLYWQAWACAVQSSRQDCCQLQQEQAAILLAWRQHVHTKAAAKHAAVKLQQLHLRQHWQAWQQYRAQQQQCAQQLAWAGMWHRRRVLCKVFMRWNSVCAAGREMTASLVAKDQQRLLGRAVQAWLQVIQQSRPQPDQQPVDEAAAAAEGLALLQEAFSKWQGFIMLQVQENHLQHMHQQRVLRRAWQLWAQLPAAKARLNSAAAAFQAVGQQLLRQWGMQAFVRHAREAGAAQHLQQWRQRQCVVKWRASAAAHARRERLLCARAAAGRQQLLQRCLWSWWRQAAAAIRQDSSQQASKLKDAICTQQSELDCARAQEASAAGQLQLLVMHNQQLQEQAVAACAGALSGLQFAPELCWRSLPFNPDAAVLQPRARHAVFWLEALQPPSGQTLEAAAAGAGLAYGPSHPATVSGMGGCLLVFGGVSGIDWLTDLTLLVLQDNAAGDMQLTALSVPYTSSSSSSSSGGGSTGKEQPTQLPVPVRDFAACPCGRNQFVISGGFSGQLEALDLQLCELVRQHPAAGESLDRPATPDRCSRSRYAGTGENSWCDGWAASWQLLQPRNPAPAGRCHHSMSYYPQGRSLVVFGGWTNKQGVLNDVWLFHQDHMEWWEPDVAGPAMPCHRRSHASALVGAELFIHGGLDGFGHHLADMWCLDMCSWQWQQVGPKGGDAGVCPAARRGHSLEVVDGRYLLLHGGYSGTHQLLHDTWVYDTHSSIWLAVNVAAPVSELPVPRALHSLTQLGHRFVLLGGQGPLGPLGDVTLLECPAVQHGLQLQQRSMQSQGQLLHCQQRCMQLAGDMSCSRSELQETRRQLSALSQDTNQMAAQHAAAAHECSTLHDKLQDASQAAAAADQRAQLAIQQAAVLERRLARARQGGCKAVQAAEGLAKQLQTAEGPILELQQQLAQSHRQLQQQQLVLSERRAEAAVLQTELADCRTRAHLAAAASNSAQTDFKTALSRSSKLYTQELQHLQGLLQAARKAQKQLAEELAALQAQPPQPAAPTPVPTEPEATLQSAEGQQQQQSPPGSAGQIVVASAATPPAATAGDAAQLGACGSSKRSSRTDDAASFLTQDMWCQLASNGGGTGSNSMVCMSADQVALLSSRQGRVQAQVEMLQQQMQAQQEELVRLKHQMRMEQQATAAAQGSRAAAVAQLQLAQQQHQQQVQQLEEQVKGYKWRLWEAELDAAAAARQGRCGFAQALPVGPAPRALPGEGHAAQSAEMQGGMKNQEVVEVMGMDIEPADKGAATAAVVAPAAAAAAAGQMPGGGKCGDFTVHMVAAPGDADLEMLPEVVKLFELHRGLMAGVTEPCYCDCCAA